MAARLDGASEVRIFWSIALNLLRPGLVTVLLFTLVATWNSYFLPLIMLLSAVSSKLGKYKESWGRNAMFQQPYTAEQVAALLGLHVKTVRAYVRDGRLKAVRLGKSYRIAREDLEAFTGRPVEPPARETAVRRRRVEVSAIVQIDAISPEAMTRLSNTLMAAVGGRDAGAARLRVETIYDEEVASLKVVVIGGLDDTAGVFRIIDTLTRSET